MSPTVDLTTDMVTERDQEATQVDVHNTCGFAFQWRDVTNKVNKVTCIVNVPSGVDPTSVDIKLIPEENSIHSSKLLQFKFESVYHSFLSQYIIIN